MRRDEALGLLRSGPDGIEEWNRRRRKMEHIADLGGAELGGAKLKDANLKSVKLQNADLVGADLWRAYLWRANLSGANLRGAELGHASLMEVNLRGANLMDTNLKGTTFRGAWLPGARLGGATLARTAFALVDLSTAEGLADVKHVAPSSIGTDSLEMMAASLSGDPSRQAEVEAFLRGAGIQENLLAWWRAQIGQPLDLYSCFISYSHDDRTFARRLHDELQARGIRCWLDEHQILPGDRILERVDVGIRLWDKVLLCCSETSLNSPWVIREIDKALKKEARLWKERAEEVLALIPLNLDGYLFKWESDRASILTDRHAPDFTGWEADNAKFEEQFERVVLALRADEGGREKPPAGKL